MPQKKKPVKKVAKKVVKKATKKTLPKPKKVSKKKPMPLPATPTPINTDEDGVEVVRLWGGANTQLPTSPTEQNQEPPVEDDNKVKAFDEFAERYEIETSTFESIENLEEIHVDDGEEIPDLTPWQRLTNFVKGLFQ